LHFILNSIIFPHLNDIQFQRDKLKEFKLKRVNTSLAIFILLFVIALSIIYFYFSAKNHIVIIPSQTGDIKYTDEMATFGTLGDYFGGVLNPILGFITFSALLFTIHLQLKQNEEAKKQYFENRFYNLLNIHNNLIDNLNYKNKTQRSSFSELINTILIPTAETNPIFNAKTSTGSPVAISRTKRKYRNFNKNENGYFGHYFRNLYRILIIIDKSSLDAEDKNDYARIVRAQLSSDELIVLYFNCLPAVCDKGQFRKLVIKYNLLEHLSIEKDKRNKTVVNEKNYREQIFTLGHKVMTIGREVSTYMPKTDSDTFGAFGKSGSVGLSELKDAIQKHKNSLSHYKKSLTNNKIIDKSFSQ